MKFYDFKNNKDFGYGHKIGNSSQYTYSMKTVEYIVGEIEKNPEGIIGDLKKAIKKERDDPRGKGF